MNSVGCQIERRKMADTEPNMHNSVISRVLGQRWQKMSYAERQPFVREADKVRQLHLQEHPDYRYCPRRREKGKPGERRGYVRQQPTVSTTRDTSPVQQSSSLSVVSSVLPHSPAHCVGEYCGYSCDLFLQNYRLIVVDLNRIGKNIMKINFLHQLLLPVQFISQRKCCNSTSTVAIIVMCQH